MDRCAEFGFAYDTVRSEADLVAAIRSSAAGVVESLRGDVDLRGRRDPAVWSPLEYGCHLRDMLLVQRERVLEARRSDEPVVCAPMGRDERVEHDGYADQDPYDVARQLSDAAGLFAGVVTRLGTTDWDRAVVYPYPAPERRSVRWVVRHTLHELRHHELDIRRQL